MSKEIPEDFLYASFFFVDVVGLSNPILSTETQRTKIKILNDSIYDSQTFLAYPKQNLFILPTGDGMLIAFKDGLEEPIKLAKELHGKLKKHNLNSPETEKIKIRIGCNVGHIFIVKDIFENVNLWGPGAIMARRVMDLGDENHVLLTDKMADDLQEISDDYKKILHPIHDFTIKHNEDILVYSAYDESFGNSNIPKKTVGKNISIPKSIDALKNTICEKVIFNIYLTPENNSAKHERKYHFSNNSIEPIYELNFGILTNTSKEFKDLNLKIFDENDNEVKIHNIFSPSSFTKDIIIKLDKPVFQGDSNRFLKMNYNVKDSNFENLFKTDTRNFELNFTIPSDSNLLPKLFHMDSKSHVKNLIEPNNKSSKDALTTFQWTKNDGINLKDIIRLEW